MKGAGTAKHQGETGPWRTLAGHAPRPPHRRHREPACRTPHDQGEDHQVDAAVKVEAAEDAEEREHAQHGEEEGGVCALAYGGPRGPGLPGPPGRPGASGPAWCSPPE